MKRKLRYFLILSGVLLLVFLVASLVWWRDAHAATLAELAPDYLPTIPKDLYTGKELAYRPEAGGCLLYSFGENGKDDEGRSPKDHPHGDDIAVRMPLKK